MAEVVASFGLTVTHKAAHEGGVVAYDLAHVVAVFQCLVAETGNAAHSGHGTRDFGVVFHGGRIVAAPDGVVGAVAHDAADVNALDKAVHTTAADVAALGVCHHTGNILVVGCVCGVCFEFHLHI